MAFDLACALRLVQQDQIQKEEYFKALRYNVYRGTLSAQVGHSLFDDIEKSESLDIPEGVEAW